MAADFKSLGTTTQGAFIAGAVTLVFSFVSRFNSVDLGPISGGFSAWHSYGVFAMLLLIVGVAIIAVKAFSAENLPEGVPWSLAALALIGLGTVLLILRGLTYEFANPGWSGYLVFLSSLALTYFAFVLFKESGEKIPEVNKKNDTPPAPPAA